MLKRDRSYQNNIKNAIMKRKSGIMMKRKRGAGIKSISSILVEAVMAALRAMTCSSSMPTLYMVQEIIKVVALTTSIMNRQK